jgi:protein-S-isoprenylcysteine O-methyltransferase Ste14
VSGRQPRALWGKLLYGSLFVVALPLVLALWAAVLDRSMAWPVPSLSFVAAGIVLLGGGLMLQATRDLYRYGHGLPMNAYPPPRLVTQGIYAWLAHPIYLGAVLFSAGISLWFRSSSGLYIVTPVLALMTLSLLYGYELPAMARRFGDALGRYRPLFSLPVSSEAPATWTKKAAMLIRTLTPWLMAGILVDYARCGEGCTGSFARTWDIEPGQVGWTLLILLPYLYVAIRLWAARTDRHLRQAAVAATLATWLGIYLNLILPHFGLAWIPPKGTLLAGSVVAAVVGASYRAIWLGLQKLCEWVANSRRDWLFAGGRFRIVNHSLYSGLAGAVGVGIADYIIGHHLAVLVLVPCALIGAALFAQLWGSSALLRPFGYWGSFLGSAAGALLTHFAFDIPISQIVLGLVLAAPFVQAIGRLRCLVQGCCHGVVTSQDLGIRVWQPQSRVVVLSGLKGQYILNTQLYSILSNLLLGLLLWSMWIPRSISSWTILGFYCILTGIERFAEDAYRGEIQTRMARGLRENQWVAALALLLGILFTLLPPSWPAGTAGQVDLFLLANALGGGLFAAFAMGMDFPKSNRRFSRLSG